MFHDKGPIINTAKAAIAMPLSLKISRFIAVLTTFLLISDWQLAGLALRSFAASPGSSIILLGTFAAGVVSVLGLWNSQTVQSSWGFFAYYGFALAYTFLLASMLVPFLAQLIPTQARTVGVLVVNALMLALAVYAHLKSRHR